eukprot:PhM_4_TR13531/c0_g1_i1/m.76495
MSGKQKGHIFLEMFYFHEKNYCPCSFYFTCIIQYLRSGLYFVMFFFVFAVLMFQHIERQKCFLHPSRLKKSSHHSDMDWLVIARHARLLHGLHESGVGVARAANVLGAGTVLEGEDGLVDHLTRAAVHNVDAEDAVSLLVGEHLHEPVGLVVGLGAAVRDEGELAHLVLRAGGLELLLGLANPRDLGVRVNDAGDGVVVHVAGLARQDLGDGDALVLSLVGEHGALVHNVTDGVHTRGAGLEVVVDLNEAALVQVHLGNVKTKVARERLAADGNEHGVALDLVRLATLGRLERESDVLALLLKGRDLRGRAELETLVLLEAVHDGVAGVAVKEGGDLVHVFGNGHVRAQATPDAAHLQANHTTADHDKVLRDALEGEHARRAQNVLLVKRGEGKGNRVGASGDNDVLGLNVAVRAVKAGDRYLAVALERAVTLHVGNLVLFEEELHTAGEASNSLLLLRHHGFEVHRAVLATQDAVLLEVVVRVVKHVRRIEKSLRRNATDVEARTAESTTALNARSLEAKLRSLNGSDVTTWATTDDDHVVGRSKAAG